MDDVETLRVRTSADNAAMRSFIALLQKNDLDRRRWATRPHLRIQIVTWIERTYHRRRQAASALDPHRIRGDHYHTGPPGRLSQPVTQTCSRPNLQQTQQYESKHTFDGREASLHMWHHTLDDISAFVNQAGLRIASLHEPAVTEDAPEELLPESGSRRFISFLFLVLEKQVNAGTSLRATSEWA